MRALLIVAALVVAGLLIWRVADVERADRSEAPPVGVPEHEAPPAPVGKKNAETSSRWRAGGRVHTAIGDQPVPGARVIVFVDRSGYRDAFATVETDADGVFRVDLEPVRGWPRHRRIGATLDVEVVAPGFTDGDRPDGVPIPVDEAAPLVAEFEREITLGTAIEGRIVDERGRSVSDARVAIYRADGIRESDERTSDLAGRFRVWVASPGSWVLRAGRGGYGAVQMPVLVAKAARIELGDLRLGGGAALDGVVVYPSGAPVPYAELYFNSTAVVADRIAQIVDELDARIADVNGRFRATGLGSGPYTIHALDTPDEHIVWEDVAAAPLVRLVVRQPRVALRIVASDGTPLIGAPFTLTMALGASRSVEDLRITRPDGRGDYYLPVGTSVVIGLAAKGFATERRELKLAEVRDYPVTVQLRETKTGAIRSTMLVRGKPWPHVVGLRDVRSGAFVGDPPGAILEPGETLTGIPPGTYRARLHAGQRAQLHTFPVTREVIVRAGEVTTVSAPAPLGARLALEFRVAGKPSLTPAYAPEIQLIEDDGPRFLSKWQRRTLAAGRRFVCMDLLAPGRHRLRIKLSGRPPITRDIHLAPGRMTRVRIELD